MIKALRKGDVGTTTKIDRLTRSMSDFFKLTEEIEEASADLVSLDEAIDTSDPTPLKVPLMATAGQHRRVWTEADIFQSCEEGRARAKATGKHLADTPYEKL